MSVGVASSLTGGVPAGVTGGVTGGADGMVRDSLVAVTHGGLHPMGIRRLEAVLDRKSTRLNSSH